MLVLRHRLPIWRSVAAVRLLWRGALAVCLVCRDTPSVLLSVYGLHLL